MKRAVVLGSGGVTGGAWELGVLQGLRDAGVDLATADLFVGSSVGAVLSAQLQCGHSIDERYSAWVALPSATHPAASPVRGIELSAASLQYFQDSLRMWEAAREDIRARIALGARAMATPNPIPEDAQTADMTRRLGGSTWPDAALKIAAVDVADGTVRFFEKGQGVPLETALAASCAQPGLQAPIMVCDRRYMDGGVAGTNIDGAAGYVLVVAVVAFPARGRTQQEIAAVRAAGGQVIAVVPDDESRAAMGPSLADITRARPAAEAGRHQADIVVTVIRDLWAEGVP